MKQQVYAALDTVQKAAAAAGETASNAAYLAGKKSEEALRKGKLNLRIRECRRNVDALYLELGEMLYAAHVTGAPGVVGVSVPDVRRGSGERRRVLRRVRGEAVTTEADGAAARALTESEPWLDWARELQSLAQAGLYYGADRFDLERYARIREIAAEMLSRKTGIPTERVKDLFCGEFGYQTPKLDTRAAVFRDGKILLVRENSGRWSLPGGWVEENLSVRENAVKETKEEAGLDVEPEFLIAVQDRKRHNLPVYAYNVCKVFILCRELGGAFQPNSETTESGWFAEDALPELAEEKNTAEQVRLCFKASREPDWVTRFD